HKSKGATENTEDTENAKERVNSSSVSSVSSLAPHFALRSVSITIEPGKTVALCGPSGSGKSTILNLLLRVYDPVSAAVRPDGRDVRKITRDSLRRHFALVQ